LDAWSKPQFKKSEMHGDLPSKRGIVVSASEERRGGAYTSFLKKIRRRKRKK